MKVIDALDYSSFPGGEVYGVLVELTARRRRVHLGPGLSVVFFVREDLAIITDSTGFVLFAGTFAQGEKTLNGMTGIKKADLDAISYHFILKTPREELIEIPEEWYWDHIKTHYLQRRKYSV